MVRWSLAGNVWADNVWAGNVLADSPFWPKEQLASPAHIGRQCILADSSWPTILCRTNPVWPTTQLAASICNLSSM
jgi:hypothetical protein